MSKAASLARVSPPPMTASTVSIDTAAEPLVHIAALEKIYATKDGGKVHPLKAVNLHITAEVFISTDGPCRVRAQVSGRTLRRHAAVRRHLPCPGARSLVPADG